MKPNAPESLWLRVDRSDGLFGCWPYMGARSYNGYGRHPLHDSTVRAHRLAFELAIGPIPAGLQVCHTCDNPPCCNPAHLFLGDQVANMADAARKDRRAVGVRSPHARLTPEAVREIRSSSDSYVTLGHRYGVSNVNIRRVALGLSWRSVR